MDAYYIMTNYGPMKVERPGTIAEQLKKILKDAPESFDTFIEAFEKYSDLDKILLTKADQSKVYSKEDIDKNYVLITNYESLISELKKEIAELKASIGTQYHIGIFGNSEAMFGKALFD